MKIDRRKLSIAIFCLFLLFVQEIYSKDGQGLSFDKVTILSVSTVLDKSNFRRTGSIAGGTWVYIKVIGLDPDYSNNHVTIGPYDCIIPEKGVNDMFLTCETKEAIYATQRENLEVSVQVQNKRMSECTGTCTFSYQLASTPVIQNIYPYIAEPGTWTVWNGIFRVSQTLQISELKIGDNQCSRFDLQLNEDNVPEIQPDGWELLSCKSGPDQEAGYYNITLRTTLGYQRDHYLLNYYTTKGLQYNFKVVPSIQLLSTNSAGDNGNLLTLYGLGFGTDESKIKVTAGGQTCSVLEASNEEIVCRVRPGAQQQSLVGSQGVRFIQYNQRDVGAMRSAAVASNGASIASSVLKQGQLGTFEVLNIESATGYRIYGYFRPPKTGDYVFYLSGDDSAEVWINLTPNVSTLATQTRILNFAEWKNWRDTWSRPQRSNERLKSDPLPLQADQYYYIEAYVYNGGGPGYFTLSVETPELNTEEIAPNAQWEVQDLRLSYTPDFETFDIRVWDHEDPFQLQFLSQFYNATADKMVDDWNRQTARLTWRAFTAERMRTELNNATQDFGARVSIRDLDSAGAVIEYCQVNNSQVCSSGVPQCAKCLIDPNTNSTQCRACQSGFFLDTDENVCKQFITGADCAARDSSCNKCIIDGALFKCVECSLGWDLVESVGYCAELFEDATNCTGNCQKCYELANSTQLCLECSSGYQLLPETATCAQIVDQANCNSIQGCSRCVPGSGQCLQCAASHELVAPNNCIKSSTDAAECSALFPNCAACRIDFRLNLAECTACVAESKFSLDGKECYKVQTNRAQCELEANYGILNCARCLQTKDGLIQSCLACASADYQLSTNKDTCWKIETDAAVCSQTIQNCTTCLFNEQTNGAICSVCDLDYELSSDGLRCLLISNDIQVCAGNSVGCSACLVNEQAIPNTVTCTACTSAEYLLRDSQCFLIYESATLCQEVSDCARCLVEGFLGTVCLSCASGFQLTQDTGLCSRALSLAECQQLSPECKTCDQTGGQRFCRSCSAGYELNALGECVQLPTNQTTPTQCVNYETQYPAVVKGRQWIVEFTRFRTPERLAKTPQIFNQTIPASKFSITKTIWASQPIRGSFFLRVSDRYGAQTSPIEISYQHTFANIISALSRSFDTYDMFGVTTGSANEGLTHRLIFRSNKQNLKGPLPLITVDASRLTGGKSGTRPTVTVTRVQEGSKRPYFQPVPDDSLYLRDELQQVYVEVNGIGAFCSQGVDCSYRIVSNSTPILNSFSVNQATGVLTYSLGVPGLTTLSSPSQVVVRYAGSLCSNLNTASLAALTCQIPLDSAGKIIVEAGSQKPEVLVVGRGYANTDAVQAIEYPLILNSISRNLTGVNGNTRVLLTGENFPLALTEGLVVKFGAYVARVISTSSKEILVLSPKYEPLVNGTVEIRLEFAGKTLDSGIQFAYTVDGVPNIQTISVTSSNPRRKRQMTIDGVGFGTDRTKVQAILRNKATSEELSLNVLSITDTQLVVQLSGGPQGYYKLRVWKDEMGDSINQVDFEYQFYIDSISPNRGSLLGGQVVTITGRNFMPSVRENNVYAFYNQTGHNLLCTVLESTETLIRFRVREYNSAFGAGNASVVIVIQSQLQEENLCPTPANCLYYYDTTLTGTAQISGSSSSSVTNFVQGQAYTVTGTLFDNVSLYLNNFDTPISNVTVTNAQTLSFEFPSFALEDSTRYEANVFVFNEGKGLGGVLFGRISFSVSQTTPTFGSIYGQLFTVTGTGFNRNQVQFLNQTQCRLVTYAATEVTVLCLPEANLVNNSNYVLTVHTDQDRFLSATSPQRYTAQASRSPIVNSFTVATQPGGTVRITLSINTTSITGDYFGYLRSGNLFQRSSSFSAGVLEFTSVPAGRYELLLLQVGQGVARVLTNTPVQVPFEQLTVPSALEVSLAGGAPLTVQLKAQDLTDSLQLYVCGQECARASTTPTSLTCTLPLLQNKQTEANFQHSREPGPIPQDRFDLFSTHPLSAPNVLDNRYLTYFESTPGQACHVGFQYRAGALVQPHKINFVPRIGKASVYDYLDVLIQGSLDGTNWTEISRITNEIKLGLNYVILDASTQNSYKYIRLFDSNGNCDFAEFNVWGHWYTERTHELAATTGCDVVAYSNGISQTATEKVLYKSSLTPLVQDVTPFFGWQEGGDTLTLTGLGFGTDPAKVQVVIDGVACAVGTVTSTSLTCTTGNKTDLTAPRSLQVRIDGRLALNANGAVFYYGLYWSRAETWGGDEKPVVQDFVYVPEGQTLIVDESTPKPLKSVIVEGTIIFADNKDLEFDAEMLVIQMGTLIAGREGKPYQHELVFTMYGNYFSDQLPEFGNKVIACHRCVLDLHGKKKIPTWTLLDSSIAANSQQLRLMQPVNWAVGDWIVIASTDFNHRNSEYVQITSVTDGGRQLTFTPALKYAHYGADEQYGTHSIRMRAEVGVLTRNIKVRGDPRDTTRTRYGAHLMVHGMGGDVQAVARIEQTEFFHTGQPKIIGRYTIHFHMNGDCSRSYVRGNAVHHSFARAVTLHNVQYLRVQENVGYWIQAHNVFLEDGVEMHNVIEYNLMVSSLSVTNMLQTDITSASYWVTNPLNTVRYNHAAGSDFYGFWYEIKQVPTGPSATSEVCPPGLPLGLFDSNVAHSNTRFGLRFFILAPRRFPCRDLADYSQADPFAANPSIPSAYTNFTAYKNGENGVLAEELGNTVFRNFFVVDSFRSAIQLNLCNYTKEDVVAENWVIVGRSQNNRNEVSELRTRAFLPPRTDGFTARNIEIYNFEPAMTIVEAMSDNNNAKLWTSGAKQSNYQNLTIRNSTSPRVVRWLGGPKHNIVWDIDGTLTGRGAPTWLSPAYGVYDGISACVRNTTTLYDGGTVLCTIPLLGFTFMGLAPAAEFLAMNLKAINVRALGRTPGFAEQLAPNQFYTQSVMEKILSGDIPSSFGIVFPSGQVINVHWKEGIDWRNMLIAPSQRFQTSYKPIVLRLNYTEFREKFEIHRQLGGVFRDNFTSRRVPVNFLLGPDNLTVNESCRFGDNFMDLEKQALYVCVSQNGRQTAYDNLGLRGVYCDESCPTPALGCIRESDYRLWSDASNWQNSPSRKLPSQTRYTEGVPQTGDDVLVPCAWRMKLDRNIELDTLVIDGHLWIDCTQDLTIRVRNIWVRGGEFIIGQPNKTCAKTIQIIFQGDRYGQNIIIDDISNAGTKTLAVTGRLEFYGSAPTTRSTRLTKTALPNDTTIQVQDLAGWKVGDLIAIGMTEHEFQEHASYRIQNIIGKTITLNDTIKNVHYGAAKETVNSRGTANINIEAKFQSTLDMRATVSHLSRNIKIIGTTEGQWGAHVLVYHWYYDNPDDGTQVSVRGSAVFQGVEFQACGHKDSPKAALHVINTNSEGEWTQLVNSVMHHSQGIAISAENSSRLLVQNTILYDQERFGVKLEGAYRYINVTGNVIVATRERTDLQATKLWSPVIGIYLVEGFDAQNGFVFVQNNVVQGVESGLGFGFKSVPCDKQQFYQLTGNQAGTTLVGVIYDMIGGHCHYAGGTSVYHATKGVLMSPLNTQNGFIIERILVAETLTVNINLRQGNGNHHIATTQLINSWSAGGMIREDCPECYSPSFKQGCFETLGMWLQITNKGGSHFPLSKKPTGFDVICTETSTFASNFLTDVTFYGFKLSYGANSSCPASYAISTNPAGDDSHAGNYMRRTKCENCDEDAYFKLLNPNPAKRGWFGGCGIQDCTGQRNVLIIDQDGTFFNKSTPSSVIANNNRVGNKLTGCILRPSWNGYYCNRNDIAILEWEAIGADKQELSNQNNTIDNDIFVNAINMWIEWVWKGPEPQNLRENRFVSYVLLNRSHNITYDGTNPADLRHRLQHRTLVGEPNNFVIVRYIYPLQLSIQVLVNNVVVPFFPFDRQPNLNLHNQTCGANNYFFRNRTIHFVVNGDINCMVRVRLINSVQINMRLATTVEEFWSSNSTQQTRFIDRIASLLQIPANRIRVVGIVRPQGSTGGSRLLQSGTAPQELVIQIESERGPGDTGYTKEDAKQEFVQMRTLTESLQAAVANQTLAFDDFNVAVTSMEAVVNVAKPQQANQTSIITEDDFKDPPQEEKFTLFSKSGSSIGIVIGVIFGILALGGLGYIFYRNWKKKIQTGESGQKPIAENAKDHSDLENRQDSRQNPENSEPAGFPEKSGDQNGGRQLVPGDSPDKSAIDDSVDLIKPNQSQLKLKKPELNIIQDESMLQVVDQSVSHNQSELHNYDPSLESGQQAQVEEINLFGHKRRNVK